MESLLSDEAPECLSQQSVVFSGWEVACLSPNPDS